jgi:hypothetical protein
MTAIDKVRSELLDILREDELSIVEPSPGTGLTPYYVRERFQPIHIQCRNEVIVGWAYRCPSCAGPFEIGLFVASDACDEGLITTDIEDPFLPFPGVFYGLTSILSQALLLTSTMQIRFSGPPQGQSGNENEGFEPSIPSSILEFAAMHGITFRSRDQIHDDEGRELFTRLLLEPDNVQHIETLGLDPLSTALLVRHDVWAGFELAWMLCFSSDPPRVLDPSCAFSPSMIDERERRRLRAPILAGHVVKALGALSVEAVDDDSDLAALNIDCLWISDDSIRCVSPHRIVLDDARGTTLNPDVPFEVVLQCCATPPDLRDRSVLVEGQDEAPRVIAHSKDVDPVSDVGSLRLDVDLAELDQRVSRSLESLQTLPASYPNTFRRS